MASSFKVRILSIKRSIKSPILATSNRCYCGSVRSGAAEAAARLIEDVAGTVRSRRQVLDANQVHKLALTLNRRQIGDADVSESPPPPGTPIPPGWHLVYFTPTDYESELGPDGADSTFSPQTPFTRRMWAGGNMSWAGMGSLRVGDEVEERTRLTSAVTKAGRSAGTMVIVEVEKEFHGPRGCALVDRRSWVFRPEARHGKAEASWPPTLVPGPTKIEDLAVLHNNFPVRQFCWSPVGLIRFSALTFNGHKIHYNEDWSRAVEAHPTVVVHGPLNLINILNYWHDVHGHQDAARGRAPAISYRAVAPLYAGETYTIQTQQSIETQTGWNWLIVACKQDGTVSMRAEMSLDK